MIDEDTDKRPVFPRQGGQTPSEKLVLPAASPFPAADSNQANGHEQHTVAMPLEAPSYQPQAPYQALPVTYDAYATHTASQPLGVPPAVPYQATIGTTWRNDPAYKVLLAAIALIIITGVAFTIYALNVFAQTASTQNKPATAVTQKPVTGVTPQGTVDLKPTFPAPGVGATGNPTVGSQPTPGATLVPTAMPSPTVQPTQPPANTNLTVQITNAPQQVNNGATVYVAIQASKPGVSVQLIVAYNAPPGFYGSAIQYTDNGGNATLTWHVRVQTHGNHFVTARIIAVARDQNGHIAQSQMIIVQVTSSN